MPVLIAKYNEIREDKAKEFDEQGGEDGMNLLGTIKVPKNLRLLTERLPKSNFEKPKKDKPQEEQPLAQPPPMVRRDTGTAL
jgi:hypothetical protein